MQNPIKGGLVVTTSDGEGFVPPRQRDGAPNDGVLLRPMLDPEAGFAFTAMSGTIEGGSEIDVETHDWSETIYVENGVLTCSIADEPPVEVQAGGFWHVDAGQSHLVQNTGDAPVRFLIMFGAANSN